MKKIFFSFLIFCFCSLTSLYPQQNLNIVYINFFKVFSEYEATKDAESTLEQKDRLRQEQREKIVEEIRQLRDKFALLTPEGKQEKQPLIEDKMKKLQEFDQQSRSEMAKTRDDALRKIVQEIKDYVKEYAEKQGYDIVLNMAEAVEVVVYGRPELDRSSDIIKGLNESYTQKRK